MLSATLHQTSALCSFLKPGGGGFNLGLGVEGLSSGLGGFGAFGLGALGLEGVRIRGCQGRVSGRPRESGRLSNAGVERNPQTHEPQALKPLHPSLTPYTAYTLNSCVAFLGFIGRISPEPPKSQAQSQTWSCESSLGPGKSCGTSRVRV